MTHSKYPSRLSRQRAIAITAITLALTQAWPLHAEEPSQLPLLSRPESRPRPNVMLTLDDSGSMTYQYLPERSFTLNGQTVAFPDDAKVFLNPRELTRNRFSYNNTYNDTYYVTAAPLSDLSDGMKLIQMQMRSPDVNGLYYDPSRKYAPWKAADGTVFGAPTPSSVWLDPLYYAPGFTVPNPHDDPVDLTASSTAEVKWYCSTEVGAPTYNDTSACLSSAKTYRPALIYLLKDKTASDPNNTSSYDEYDLNANVTEIAYPGRLPERIQNGCRYDDGDSKTHCPKDIELQNYANWFAFHRSRIFVARGAIPDALRTVKSAIRLGWGTIHPQHSIDKQGNEQWSQYTADADLGDATLSGSVQQGVRPLLDRHLSNFTTWIRGMQTLRRTPTLQAIDSVGLYFQRDRSSAFNPWLTNIGTGGANAAALACRRSYHIVITDGYYSSASELTGNDDVFVRAGINTLLTDDVGNYDKNNIASIPGTTVDGTLLTQSAFKDELSNTLADHVMKLWLTDLQPGIDNLPRQSFPQLTSTDQRPTTDQLLAEVKADPATWQHLTHFMVGFGVSGTLQRSDDTLKNILNGSASWPANLNRIDDLWHAAVNSRGDYFEAKNSKALQDSISEALRRSSTDAFKEAGVATAGAALLNANDNIVYAPEYHQGTWSGDVTAYTVDAMVRRTGDLWSANLRLAQQITASANAGQPNPRHIWIHDGSSVKQFSEAGYSALSTDTAAAISIDAAKYLIGAISDIDGLRPRPVRIQGTPAAQTRQYLSDFVNSTPLLVSKGVDLGYNKSGSEPGYTSYLQNKSTRTDGALFVGGNDGMLHAFKASNGDEAFAFIPAASIPHLGDLAKLDYGITEGTNAHRFFVDGPMVEADVQLGATHTWTNVVVGTMGAGARGLFALKLNDTDPTAFTSQSLVWELMGIDTGTAHDPKLDIGYITSKPQIGRLPDHSWKVFVGNGVDSASGNASLLMIDMDTGVVTSVVAYEASTQGANTTPNGLGGVTLIRDPATQNVIGAYAGDLLGNVWRFNVLPSNANDPTSASSVVVAKGTSNAATPLFQATDGNNHVQPVTAAPIVVNHRQGGQVVLLNTGKLITSGDVDDQTIQTVYGIWDKKPFDGTTDGQISTVSRTELQPQVISRASQDYLSVTSHALNWSEKKGWLMDLDIPGLLTSDPHEYPKGLYSPIQFGGSVVLTAMIPSARQESCTSAESKGYVFVLKALTGARAQVAAIDTNGDGKVDGADNPDYAGYSTEGGPINVLSRGSGSGASGSLCINGVTINPVSGKTIRDCGEAKDRIWRQLFNPPHP